MFVLAFLLGPAAVKEGRERFHAARAQQNSPVSLPLVMNGSGAPDQINTRRVNVPYTDGEVTLYRMAIFWLGQVSPSENYADVRVGYNNTELVIDVEIIDRLIWYDQTPPVQDLTGWDAVTLFMSVVENPGSGPGISEYQWVAQMSNGQAREDYQVVYRGNGSGWNIVAIPFTTTAVWRGDGVNDNNDDKGWWVTYHIPFSSLGYATPPHEAVWRLGVAVHDRDSSAGDPLADKHWPEALDQLNPDSWGSMHFGLPTYQPSTYDYDGVTVIRDGENGVVAQDAHVGGAFNCGEGIDHWSQWGNMNYESIDPTQVIIQNQRDVSDYPCFSKLFINYPLNLVPQDVEIISATLTMYHFGNSYPPLAIASSIHVFTIRESWEDTTITWNNAPLAWTNISRTRVEPIKTPQDWPGISYAWDVSGAVHEALILNESLNLALYSSDSNWHSGKYFYSFGSGWPARPFLTVWWKNP